MARLFSLIFFLLMLVIGLTFAVLNAEPVKLDYYFGSQYVPLSLTLVLALIIGAIFGALASAGLVLRVKRENARLQKAIKVAEKEVVNLRTMPIKEVQ